MHKPKPTATSAHVLRAFQSVVLLCLLQIQIQYECPYHFETCCIIHPQSIILNSHILCVQRPPTMHITLPQYSVSRVVIILYT